MIHIPRERPSLLPELFAERCAVRVKEAEDKEPVQRGTVYFAPPDYHLLIDRGPGRGGLALRPPRLALSGDEPVHFSRPSIDVLFESAADAYGKRLLGLILTGANEDGADGLAAVRRAGGRTVVQDPHCAAVPILPEAALSRGPADFLLSLEQLQGSSRAALREDDYDAAEIVPMTADVKCLLVDDVEENLLVLSALLRRDDVEILQARSGAEALELLLVHEVALALLDVQMPEMDGFELAELMRGSDRTRHVPIIFVTAGVRDYYRVFKGYETGAVDFLHKPIDPHIIKSKAEFSSNSTGRSGSSRISFGS